MREWREEKWKGMRQRGGTERKLKFVHFRATSISLDQKLVQILNLIIMDFTIAFKKSQKMDFMNHKNTQFYYQCILYPKKDLIQIHF